MAIGHHGYQFRLSKLAYNFNGALTMEYLESVPILRIEELIKHANIISDELKNGK